MIRLGHHHPSHSLLLVFENPCISLSLILIYTSLMDVNSNWGRKIPFHVVQDDTTYANSEMVHSLVSYVSSRYNNLMKIVT